MLALKVAIGRALRAGSDNDRRRVASATCHSCSPRFDIFAWSNANPFFFSFPLTQITMGTRRSRFLDVIPSLLREGYDTVLTPKSQLNTLRLF